MAEPPKHTAVGLEIILTVGVMFTETVTIAELVHVPLLPITVYVVVTRGISVTVAPFKAIGSHAYTNPPVAVNVIVLPLQITVGLAFAVIVGVVLTVIVITAEEVHPPLAPITV